VTGFIVTALLLMFGISCAGTWPSAAAPVRRFPRAGEGVV
jgi:hypothetical protein